MRRTVLTLVLGAALALAGCGNDEQADAPATATSPTSGASERSELCFKGEWLQIMGGKSLAAIGQARNGGPPVRNDNLDAVVRGALGPSLRAGLRQLSDSGGMSAQVVAAAESALMKVKSEPQLLLDESALEVAFSDAQRLAEDGGFSSPRCGSSAR